MNLPPSPPSCPTGGPVPDGNRTGKSDSGRSIPPCPRFPAEAVAGVTELWQYTHGHPDITIGFYDGPPDTAHPCLEGADLRVLPPWWLPPAADDPGLVEHGTFTASVLFGQPGSVLPGLAPRCRGISLADTSDGHTSPDPLHAARAVDELLEAGADVIQFTVPYHTASGDADELLKRAVNRALDAGVLIVAPAGNDHGHCGIAPAVLPGVLAVGAHRADGTMFRFSNFGPAYRGHGITALGEAVLGATPGGGVQARKGTCAAVALVTGVAALLLSLQRRLGQAADPLAVRDALLVTARPCTPGQSGGQVERCLDGYLDLPAATRLVHAAAPARPCGALPPTVVPADRPVRRSPRAATVTTIAERPHLAQAEIAQPSSPAFLGKDMAGRWAAHARLQQRFPQFGVVATDAGGSVVGRGWGVPFALSAPGRGQLPDGGWDEILTWAFADLQDGSPPDTLGLLAIVVRHDQQRAGLAGALLAALKNAAQVTGLRQVVAPVRPTRKHREPATPMAEYARRTRADGLPADPWLRTHVRAGGRIDSIASASMVVAGSLAQWRRWTRLPFDTDGPVTVPGALVPVHCALAHDHAVYVEPNVWVRHLLP
ncbi:GNAT superfamily N-acetyltransferase [Streptosporangium becharense]|uniref:GNAT superfamily N-acetyltransferase n=1 Tax=Streptosporangium becharense TaxID=1816182 RepID=A0A7W9IB77_9ACTN|nr:S8 family serine peptidase [Streptosporangium becharense]MBB2915318.1 GNAT superfamily N-acetyltransferase [Streptosporangium becharense]MBB5816984.1 GNAT superfamily N-acetyltransferase [Streptosporangium becharense]